MWRHTPCQILYAEYEPQASIFRELWLGLWRNFKFQNGIDQAVS